MIYISLHALLVKSREHLKISLFQCLDADNKTHFSVISSTFDLVNFENSHKYRVFELAKKFNNQQ